jgi:predicted MFS family arabinose efflux permease
MSTQSPPAPVNPEISMRRLNWLTFVLAAASGVSIANIFYSQPLLELIAKTYNVTDSTASIVVTVTQLGYAAGIIVLMPLGDLIENRALASRVLVVTAIAAAVAGFATSLPFFLVCSVILGFTSVVAQIVVPLAAHLAPEGQGGRYVGRVMSGLLLGIMLARSASSFLADLTVFIGSVFFGGAIGSALSGALYDRADWSGVATLGTVLALIGVTIWAASQLLQRRVRVVAGA